MYNIGICDDGKNTCAVIEKMISVCAEKKNMEIETSVWYAGEQLCEYLQQGGQLDIIFLDIELLELSGIEVGDFIRNKLENRGMQIIYISGEASYAHRLFKTQPMDFLVKPITQQQIEDAIELAVKILEKKAAKFEFQNGKDHLFVPYSDILYFESEARKIKVVTLKTENEFYGSMKELEKNLPMNFLSIHQSYMINKEHVVRYTYEMVEMDNGTILMISKAHRKQVRDRLLRGW